MAAEILTRTTRADLEVRGGDGRTVVGLVVPFDTPGEVPDARGGFTETFRRGAFARTITERAGRVKFLAQHDMRALPLGRATLLREDAAGLYGEFRVSATAAGDEALELVRDGAVDAFSVGFRPVRDRWSADRSSVERLEVALLEVSATAFPVYPTAEITDVRSDLPASPLLSGVEAALAAADVPVLTRSTARARLGVLCPPVPVSDAYRRLANLETRNPR